MALSGHAKDRALGQLLPVADITRAQPSVSMSALSSANAELPGALAWKMCGEG